MLGNGTIGSKRPHGNKENAEKPRKRPQAEGDDDLIDEAFDMEPTEDDVDDVPADLDVEDDVLGEAGKNWVRPAPPQLDAARDRLVFQQLEVDYTSGAPNQQFYKSDLQEVPILRMFGVTELGARYSLQTRNEDDPGQDAVPAFFQFSFVYVLSYCCFQ